MGSINPFQQFSANPRFTEGYSNVSGPRDKLTHQPTDGKSRDGGLRVGEMEKDCMMARGMIRSAAEKLGTDSDGVYIYICKRCRNRAIANEKEQIYICNRCGDMAEFVRVQSSWSSNLMLNELSAAGVGLTMQTSVPPYSSQM